MSVTRLGSAQLGGQDAAEAGAAAELQHAPRRDQLRVLRQLPAFPCASLKLQPAWRGSGYCRQGPGYYKNACQASTVGNIYQAQLFYAAMCVSSVVRNFTLQVETSAQAVCGAPMPRHEGSRPCSQEHCAGRRRAPAQAVRGAPHARAKPVAQGALPHRHAHAAILQVLQLRVRGW